jgi:hypothetical protein
MRRQPDRVAVAQPRACPVPAGDGPAGGAVARCRAGRRVPARADCS